VNSESTEIKTMQISQFGFTFWWKIFSSMSCRRWKVLCCFKLWLSITYFSPLWPRYLTETIEKKERFILASGFRGPSCWSREIHIMASRK
jgi:hypothetical protein